MRRAVSFCLGVMLIVSSAIGQNKGENKSGDNLERKDTDERIERLVRQMTLEQKAGQLCLMEPFSRNAAQTEDLIAKGLVGAISPSFNGVKETETWQHAALEKSPLHIPLLIGLDVIHGHRTIFPVPLALAGSFDPELMMETTRVAASEAKLDSVNLVFAPMVDVSRDARWGRIIESPGEDPFLASVVARAYVRGFQGAELSDPNSVATSVKHYAGYGAAESGRDYNSVDMSERTLRSVYLPPFKAAVEAGSGAVMSAFNTMNSTPVAANHHMLTDILRREWGFSGFVLSDAGAIAELKKHGVALDDAEAVKRTMLAGLDMDLGGDSYATTIPSLVRSGKLAESVVDEAVRRVLRVKFALGLFDHPYGSQSALSFRTEDKRKLARKAVHESLVLLKNEVGNSGRPVLPLKDVKTLAVIGPFADAAAQMMGPWAVVGESSDVITLKTSLAARMTQSGGKLLYAKGCEILNETERMSAAPSIGEFIGKPEPQIAESERLRGRAGFAQALETARQADVVVMVLGEDRTMSGEAGSRTRLDLPGEQQALLEAISATGKPIALVLFNGRPLALPWAAAHVPAILEAWYPGDEAGPGISDILFGDANPSGHLAASFPRSVGQEPLYYGRLTTGRPPVGLDLSHPPREQRERFYSRYIDEQNTALFPFGWGLSYSTFTFSTPEVSVAEIPVDSLRADATPATTVTVNVKNSGTVPGDAVVQLYLGITGASVALPERELKGFRRVHLAAGESKEVAFPLGVAELSFLDENAKPTLERVHYRAWVGDSSIAEQHADFRIK